MFASRQRMRTPSSRWLHPYERRRARYVTAQHPELVTRARVDLADFRWEQIQRARFHLRIGGRPGQRLTVAIRSDGLFDANFATRPALAESDVRLDLARQHPELEATLDDLRL